MSWLTSRHRSFGALALLAGASLLGLTGCQTTGDLTVDLPDPTGTSSTNLSTYLDVPVSVSTVLLDPAPTLKTDHYLVGRLRDQLTGVTEARGVLNLRPSSILDSLPSRLLNSTLESVVFAAPFEEVYGTATAPLRFDILTLKDKLDDRVVYKADTTVITGTTIVTGLSAPLNATRQVNQTSTDGTGTVIPTTQPDPVVAQVLQKDKSQPNPLFTSIFAKLNSSAFSQAELDKVLPGIVLAPSTGYEGSIVSFGRDRVAPQFKFIFTYDSVQTAPLPSVRRKRSYSLFFGPGRGGSGEATATDPRFYTQLTTNKGGSQLAALNDKSQAVTAAALDGRSYLQEGIELGTRITFTDLAQLEALRLKSPGVAINRAELLVPVQPYTSGVFPYPAHFYALEVDAQNQVLTRSVNGIVTERIVQRNDAPPKGAGYEAVASLINSGSTGPYYSFLMTDYLQAYLSTSGLGTDAPKPAALVLTPTLRSIRDASGNRVLPSLTLNRAVIDANNIKLRVYYSQLR